MAQPEPPGFEDPSGGEEILDGNNADHPCLTGADYHQLSEICSRNADRIGWPRPGGRNQVTALEWPLRGANGLTDCSYYVITAFVDQDQSSGSILDYHCGSRTYDGHRGTDIAIFPYRFIRMDHDQVEVIAAAEGIILDKADGNTDKNCGTNPLQANYVVIGHADGSRALYFHMKKNSVTVKSVGDTVLVGEYLGVVGSSGNSSGPHLHFEVWSGSTVSTRIDPFSGMCNSLNPVSWWKDQKPYDETAVVKVSTNSTDIVIPACPETETPHEQACFPLPFQGQGLPAGYAKFYMFLRQEISGLTATLRILNPDSTVYLGWTHTSTNTNASSWWGFSKKLPTLPGRYTFEATYNGATCRSEFEVLDVMITVQGPSSICPGDSLLLSANAGFGFLWTGGQTTQQIYVGQAGEYSVTIQGEYGCSSVSPPVGISEFPPGDGLSILQLGDSLLSPYSGEVFWYLDGQTEPVDSGQVILCHGDGLYITEGQDEHGCHAVSQAKEVICPETAISGDFPAPSIRIVPNPTPGWVEVKVGKREIGGVRLSMSDLTGRLLVSRSWSEAEQDGLIGLDLETYPAGVYFLVIQGRNWRVERVLIRQD